MLRMKEKMIREKRYQRIVKMERFGKAKEVENV